MSSSLAKKMLEKWKSRTPAAADDWMKYTTATEEDPIKRALEENDKRIAMLQQSIKDKVWETKMGRLTKADWLASITEDARDRFRSATTGKGAVKYEKKVDTLAKIATEAKAEARKIKIKTIDDAIKRVEAVVKVWKKYKGKI